MLQNLIFPFNFALIVGIGTSSFAQNELLLLLKGRLKKGKSIMRNIILLLVACAISISLFGQKMEFIPHTAEPHFCPLLEGISSHYVPPRSKMPYTKSKTTFEATYIGDMPVEAQVAFDHTLNLLF